MPRLALDRETIDGIMLDLASGATFTDCAGRAGFSKRAIEKWRKRGDEVLARVEAGESTVEELTDDERHCMELVEGIARARSTVVVDALAQIRSAFSRNWRSAAWYMERSDPDNWGRPYRERPVRAEETDEDAEPSDEDKDAIVSAAVSFAERRAKREAEKTG